MSMMKETWSTQIKHCPSAILFITCRMNCSGIEPGPVSFRILLMSGLFIWLQFCDNNNNLYVSNEVRSFNRWTVWHNYQCWSGKVIILDRGQRSSTVWKSASRSIACLWWCCSASWVQWSNKIFPKSMETLFCKPTVLIIINCVIITIWFLWYYLLKFVIMF